jgi:23S rRNA (uracil747-C5)-methyltransferase
MVRFVTRSQEPVTRIRKHLPWLRERLPNLMVATVNLQPEHKAVVEGPDEIVLTETGSLRMVVNGHSLLLRPQSFFQTNTTVAAALYRDAIELVTPLSPDRVWDLYCGVGGFALHLAANGRSVIGVETSAEAVRSARTAAIDAPGEVRFEAADAEAWALEGTEPPDLVVVNPPRRGIGAQLAGRLDGSGVGHVLYSSCNPESLARDLEAMPGLVPVRARLFDMFPHTDHAEVLVLLSRSGGAF